MSKGNHPPSSPHPTLSAHQSLFFPRALPEVTSREKILMTSILVICAWSKDQDGTATKIFPLSKKSTGVVHNFRECTSVLRFLMISLHCYNIKHCDAYTCGNMYICITVYIHMAIYRCGLNLEVGLLILSLSLCNHSQMMSSH